MSFTVRDLLARLKMLRTDVINDSPAILCLNEAVRTVCRETGIAVTKTSTAPLLSGTTIAEPTTTLGSVLRVDRVFVSDIPEGSYKGTVNPTTGAITPADGAKTVVTGSATTFSKGDFWIVSEVSKGDSLIVSAASTTVIDGSEEDWDIGDVVYSDGTKFVQMKQRAFKLVDTVNLCDAYTTSRAPQSRLGSVRGVAIQDGQVQFLTTPEYDNAVVYELAYIPASEIVASIPLPMSAEECVLNTAISMYYMLPGEQQDKRSSQEYRRKSQIEMGNLEIHRALGGSGTPHMKSINFFGN